ncbi:LytTR family transcriptional regulator DNA-binding domain-containing protein [Frigidibacter sp. RF13]|uniref:LytTR family DNA-binding domain-containing protein n=1 Tax=Frigidibacter sp. RF13 TaxID=2997340 RepID=UPI002270C6B2|nr:LytTR family DNA-binding domain-containing protein [Frigidibacter sp. RF13]MCY1128608.1 LytTR family transcriptional regulator DNA-binding domain-containing protein [Frigidibacter sp. RF13]
MSDTSERRIMDTGVLIVWTNGWKRELSRRNLWRIALNRRTALSVFVFFLIMSIVQPYSQFRDIPAYYGVLIDGTGVIIAYFTYLLLADLAIRTAQMMGATRVYEVFVAAVASSMLTFWIVVTQSVALGVTVEAADFLEMMAMNLVLSTVFSSLIATFIMDHVLGPKLDGEISVSDVSEGPISLTQRQAIVVQGQEFVLDEIIWVNADDKFVEIVTEAGASRVRARFSEVSARLGSLRGMLVHRSHWVAKKHIVALHRDALGNRYLEISVGKLVPVSRMRLKEVTALVQRDET